MKQPHRQDTSEVRLSSRGRILLGIVLAVLGILVLLTAPTVPAPASRESGSSVLKANPYGPGDFVREGDYLTCLTGNARPGVDVSSHQEEIDWEQVAGAGMEFAMIRIGYRGTSEGQVHTDAMAEQNLQQARQAGLQVGAYFFSQAVTEAEAAEEAALCIRFLENQTLDLPVVFDWEYVDRDARTAAADGETVMACARTFCDALEAAGYPAMIYFNLDLSRNYLDLEQLSDLPFWLAQYGDGLDWPYAVEMWQYSDRGSVPGISGHVDLNLWFDDGSGEK